MTIHKDGRGNWTIYGEWDVRTGQWANGVTMHWRKAKKAIRRVKERDQ